MPKPQACLKGLDIKKTDSFFEKKNGKVLDQLPHHSGSRSNPE
jgi:hypothetical protein